MKKLAKTSRQKRVRFKTKGTLQKMRLSVFRSNKFIYAQIIDDQKQKTVVGVSEKEISAKKGSKLDNSKEVGLLVAKKALQKKVNEVIFDRGSYKYHGRVKALAEGAREGGLKF